VPAPPRNWSRFTLCLDLDPKWPKTLRLTRDVFKLFTVPIINLQRTTASPVICDGTKDRYPIRHPALERRFALHSVRGVYKIEDGVMTPLLSGTLSSGTGTYEIEEEVDADGARRHGLSLHFPEAFQRPRTISVDGLWLQPWFSSVMAQRLHVAPYRSVFPGLKWEILGDMVSHRESGFADDMDSFLHLFVLQNKRVMNLNDVDILLQTLGSVWDGPFAELRDELRGLRVEEVPLKADGSSGALKLVYWLGFSEGVVESAEPLVRSFILHAGRILDAWVSDATVEVRMEVKS
jgi:type VI secretion system protein ImpG